MCSSKCSGRQSAVACSAQYLQAWQVQIQRTFESVLQSGREKGGGIPRPKSPHPKTTGEKGPEPRQNGGIPALPFAPPSVTFLLGATGMARQWGTACLNRCQRVKERSCRRLRSERDPQSFSKSTNSHQTQNANKPPPQDGAGGSPMSQDRKREMENLLPLLGWPASTPTGWPTNPTSPGCPG